jgi:hypothetical protein
VNLDFINYDWHGSSNPTTFKDEADRLLKSLLVETSGMLPKRFFARNSDMIFISTMGLYMTSMIAPLTNKA